MGLACAWLALLGVWMLLVDSTDFREVLAGVIVAALGAATFRLSVRRAAEGLIPALRGAALWRLPVAALRDSGLVLGATLVAGLRRRSLRGRFVSLPFPVGGASPEAAARRAVCTATRSFTPNTCVAGFDAEHGEVVVHRLVRRGGA